MNQYRLGIALLLLCTAILGSASIKPPSRKPIQETLNPDSTFPAKSNEQKPAVVHALETMQDFEAVLHYWQKNCDAASDPMALSFIYRKSYFLILTGYANEAHTLLSSCTPAAQNPWSPQWWMLRLFCAGISQSKPVVEETLHAFATEMEALTDQEKARFLEYGPLIGFIAAQTASEELMMEVARKQSEQFPDSQWRIFVHLQMLTLDYPKTEAYFSAFNKLDLNLFERNIRNAMVRGALDMCWTHKDRKRALSLLLALPNPEDWSYELAYYYFKTEQYETGLALITPDIAPRFGDPKEKDYDYAALIKNVLPYFSGKQNWAEIVSLTDPIKNSPALLDEIDPRYFVYHHRITALMKLGQEEEAAELAYKYMLKAPKDLARPTFKTIEQTAHYNDKITDIINNFPIPGQTIREVEFEEAMLQNLLVIPMSASNSVALTSVLLESADLIKEPTKAILSLIFNADIEARTAIFSEIKKTKHYSPEFAYGILLRPQRLIPHDLPPVIFNDFAMNVRAGRMIPIKNLHRYAKRYSLEREAADILQNAYMINDDISHRWSCLYEISRLPRSFFNLQSIQDAFLDTFFEARNESVITISDVSSILIFVSSGENRSEFCKMFLQSIESHADEDTLRYLHSASSGKRTTELRLCISKALFQHNPSNPKNADALLRSLNENKKHDDILAFVGHEPDPQLPIERIKAPYRLRYFLEHKQWESASTALQDYVAINPEEALSIAGLAFSDLVMHRQYDAASQLDRSLSQQPNLPIYVNFYQARLYLKLKNREKFVDAISSMLASKSFGQSESHSLKDLLKQASMKLPNLNPLPVELWASQIQHNGNSSNLKQEIVAKAIAFNDTGKWE